MGSQKEKQIEREEKKTNDNKKYCCCSIYISDGNGSCLMCSKPLKPIKINGVLRKWG